MSDYTTELRYLPREDFDLAMSAYPIFNEIYRPTLNDLIYNHFWRHEIGVLSVEEFFRNLTVTMREIMGVYNQYYNVELLTYDPFIEYSKEMTQDTDEVNNIIDKVVETLDEKVNKTDNNVTTGSSSLIGDSTYSEDADGTNDINSTTERNNDTSNTTNNSSEKSADTKGVGSNTPAKLLAIGTIESNVYASNATIDETSEEEISSNNSIGESSETGVNVSNAVDETHREGLNHNETDTTTQNESNTTVVDNKTNDNVKDGETNSVKNQEVKTIEEGHTMSKTKLLIELRESFIDVDSMILADRELNECFMQIL